MKKRRGLRCRCGKLSYTSLQAAKLGARAAGERSGTSDPIRFYQCAEERNWHWTRKKTWKEFL